MIRNFLAILLALAVLAVPAVATEKIYVVPFQERVAEGSDYGQIAVDRFSKVTKIGGVVGAASAPVWPADSLYTFRVTAGTLEVTSADDDDFAADTGAKTVTIEGLDSSYKPITETVTMSGNGAAISGNLPTVNHTTQSFLRVNKAFVATSGTSGVNEGLIYVGYDHAAGGASGVQAVASVQALIPAGEGVSTPCVYTTPANYDGVVTKIFAESDVGTTSIQLLANEYGESWMLKADFVIPASLPFQMDTLVPVGEKADMKLIVPNGGSKIISAAFRLILHKN